MIKQRFPIDSCVKVLKHPGQQREKKKSHKKVWSVENYFICGYKTPPSPLEEIGLRLRTKKIGGKTIKGIFYEKELKYIHCQ